jgi:hypothetical protein
MQILELPFMPMLPSTDVLCPYVNNNDYCYLHLIFVINPLLPTALTMSEKSALLPKHPRRSRSSPCPVLVIHGGAGTFSKEQ